MTDCQKDRLTDSRTSICCKGEEQESAARDALKCEQPLKVQNV